MLVLNPLWPHMRPKISWCGECPYTAPQGPSVPRVVRLARKLTCMSKTQVYLPDEGLEALRSVGRRTGRSVAELVREAVHRVWLRPDSSGPVALWGGTPAKTSFEHDAIYDEA